MVRITGRKLTLRKSASRQPTHWALVQPGDSSVGVPSVEGPIALPVSRHVRRAARDRRNRTFPVSKPGQHGVSRVETASYRECAVRVLVDSVGCEPNRMGDAFRGPSLAPLRWRQTVQHANAIAAGKTSGRVVVRRAPTRLAGSRAW